MSVLSTMIVLFQMKCQCLTLTVFRLKRSGDVVYQDPSGPGFCSAITNKKFGGVWIFITSGSLLSVHRVTSSPSSVKEPYTGTCPLN